MLFSEVVEADIHSLIIPWLSRHYNSTCKQNFTTFSQKKLTKLMKAANLGKARAEGVMILNTDSASLTRASKWFCRTSRRLDSQGLFLDRGGWPSQEPF